MKRKFALGILLIISILTLAFKIELVSAIVPEYPAIYVDPAEIIDPTLVPGTNFTIAIKTDYLGDDINAYQFTLSYDPNVLAGVSVVNDGILSDAISKLGTFDNVAGRLSTTSAFYFGAGVVRSGPGKLATITFDVVGLGDSELILGSNTLLKGWDAVLEEPYDIVDAVSMPFHLGHGYFSNIDGLPPPAITATVNIKPNSLNLRNKGQRITAYIKLPESYDVGDIDVSTILLNNTIPAISSRVTGNKLMVRFDRAEVIALLNVGEITLSITGEVSGTPFEGSDTIIVR